MKPKAKGALTLADQSRMAIAEALLRLMETEEFHQITVLQVCQEAGLSRRTFYRHFPTKEAVLRHLLIHMSQDFIRTYDIANATIEEEFLYSYDYFSRHRAMLVLLHRHRLFHLIKELLEEYMRGSCTQEYAQRFGQAGMEPYFDSYFAGSISAILELWVSRGFDRPPEALARFTLHLHSSLELGCENKTQPGVH